MVDYILFLYFCLVIYGLFLPLILAIFKLFEIMDKKNGDELTSDGIIFKFIVGVVILLALMFLLVFGDIITFLVLGGFVVLLIFLIKILKIPVY